MSYQSDESLPMGVSESKEEKGLKELLNIIKELNKPINQGLKTNPCDEVHPRVFVGDRGAATDLNLLRDLGITHVVNAADGNGGQGLYVNTGAAYYHEQGLPVCYLGLPVLDLPEVNISRHFTQVAEFIDAAVSSGGKVLVHCMMGVSRSAACVIAYLMIKTGKTVAEALKQLMKRRPTVRPNDGFLRQLLQLQAVLQPDRRPTSKVSQLPKDRLMNCPDLFGGSAQGRQDQEYSGSNSTIAYGPFALCPDNDPVIPYPRPPPSVELRSGVLISGCQCVKRDGLQHDCPRTGCQGRAHCMAFPAPMCVPSGNSPPDFPYETSSTTSCSYADYGRDQGRRKRYGEADKRSKTRGEFTPRGHQQDVDYVQLARREYVENPAVRCSHQKRVPCREHKKIRA